MATGKVKNQMGNVTFTVFASVDSFTVPNNYRGIAFLASSSENKNGVYIVVCDSGGNVSAIPVKSASGVTVVTTTKNTLGLTGAANVVFLSITAVAPTEK